MEICLYNTFIPVGFWILVKVVGAEDKIGSGRKFWTKIVAFKPTCHIFSLLLGNVLLFAPCYFHEKLMKKSWKGLWQALPMWEWPHAQIPEDTESGTTWHSNHFDIFTEQAAASVVLLLWLFWFLREEVSWAEYSHVQHWAETCAPAYPHTGDSSWDRGQPWLACLPGICRDTQGASACLMQVDQMSGQGNCLMSLPLWLRKSLI